MIYRRLPRSQSEKLSREQLRVYTMCDGRNPLSEVIALTRLEPEIVRSAVRELLELGLLEAVSTMPPPGRAGQAPQTTTNPAPASFTLLAQVETVLRGHMGDKAEAHLAVLRSCTTVEEIQEQGSRLAVKLKLTVNRQVSEALLAALRSSL